MNIKPLFKKNDTKENKRYNSRMRKKIMEVCRVSPSTITFWLKGTVIIPDKYFDDLQVAFPQLEIEELV